MREEIGRGLEHLDLHLDDVALADGELAVGDVATHLRPELVYEARSARGTARDANARVSQLTHPRRRHPDALYEHLARRRRDHPPRFLDRHQAARLGVEWYNLTQSIRTQILKPGYHISGSRVGSHLALSSYVWVNCIQLL
jgi:hypothetical protein